MTMEIRSMKKKSLWCGFLILLILTGCASRESVLHLQPGQQVQEPTASSRAQVQLDLFREDFFREQEVIGGHFFHGEHQILKTGKGEIARILRSMIAQHLAENNVPFAYAGQGGLSANSAPVTMDGRISRLWLEVKSGVTHSKYELKIEITSRLQMGTDKKVISRTINVGEEAVKLTSQPAEMEKLLDKSLEEAARQIAQKVMEDLRAAGFVRSQGGWR
jgi:hypothetical protein